jgi:hypothetical protein
MRLNIVCSHNIEWPPPDEAARRPFDRKADLPIHQSDIRLPVAPKLTKNLTELSGESGKRRIGPGHSLLCDYVAALPSGGCPRLRGQWNSSVALPLT